MAAEPTIDRRDVISAAHEVAAHLVTGERLTGRSLFDLPLGEGHSWTITEQERPAWRAGHHLEQFAEVALPAWEINGTLDLLSSGAFGADAAARVLMEKVGPGLRRARQVAVATFDRYGFKAAAITAIAVAGRPDSGGRFRGLPLFEAWIHTPTDVDPTDRDPE